MDFPQEIEIDFSGDDLAAELFKATEVKAQGGEVDDAVIESMAEAEAAFIPPKEVVEPAPEKEMPAMPVDYYDAAETTIYMVDGVNRLAFPWAYFRSAFTRHERRLIKENVRLFKVIERKPGGSNFEALSDELKDIFERWLEVREIVAEIPFTDKEVEYLAKPLSKVLEKYAKAPGPEAALGSAILMVYGKRIAPIMSGLL